ncbi:response regulator transcription factor [Pseudomaricurvus sp.]|uniref:helix-turn-helix transcriptional regulator n=1 Tax=Pseudomaricurvus sp. TaxID=2004510 RepID=UPI003F6C40E0
MEEQQTHIHQIWDKLADWPAAQAEQALKYLLNSICTLVDADHSYWLSAYRMSPSENDPLLGWRLGPVFYPAEEIHDQKVYRGAQLDEHEGIIDESSYNHVRQSGRFRSLFLRDHVTDAYYSTPQYHRHYRSRGLGDTMFVIAPVNKDSEAYFCFNRSISKPQFSQADLDLASDCLRSLKWFHKQVLLHHGLLIAEAALTPTEKRVLQLLLTDQTEKQIAESLGQKVDTTHKHVVSIYRKFNVNSRAALMAIWLGHTPEGE